MIRPLNGGCSLASHHVTISGQAIQLRLPCVTERINEEGDMEQPLRDTEVIPDSITRDHILQAMAVFDKSGLPAGYQKSIRYDVVNDGRYYPPPALMALAIRQESGALPPGIRGGKKTKCFEVLRDCGFEIITKTKSS